MKAILAGTLFLGACYGWLQIEQRYPMLLRLSMDEYAPYRFDEADMRRAIEHYDRTGEKIAPLRRYNADHDRFEEYDAASKKYRVVD